MSFLTSASACRYEGFAVLEQRPQDFVSVLAARTGRLPAPPVRLAIVVTIALR